MDIVSNISDENKLALENLEAAVLREKLRQASERIAQLDKQLREKDEITDLVVSQRVEEGMQAERAKDSAERAAIEAARQRDVTPSVPQRSDNYEDYLNASDKTKAQLIKLYGAGFYEQQAAEYYRKKRRERDLFGGIKKK